VAPQELIALRSGSLTEVPSCPRTSLGKAWGSWKWTIIEGAGCRVRRGSGGRAPGLPRSPETRASSQVSGLRTGVWKIAEAQVSGGSNPSPSAMIMPLTCDDTRSKIIGGGLSGVGVADCWNDHLYGCRWAADLRGCHRVGSDAR